MRVITEGEWIRPYDHFKNSNLGVNLHQADAIEAYLGQSLSGLVRNTAYTPSFNNGDEVIDFDFAHLDPHNINQRPDGVRIYYPIRTPRPEEIEPRNNPGENPQYFARGFGSLGVVLGGQDRFQMIRGQVVFPFRLDIKGVGAEEFQSLPSVYVEEERSGKVPYAAFSSWFSATTRIEGQIYSPLTLPDLQKFNFRLTRINPEIA